MEILVPRNLEKREEKQIKNELCKIREYIKHGSKGSLNLSDYKLTKLPDELVEVGGDLYIYGSCICDLNNLKYVHRNLYANLSKLAKLPDNLHVGGYLSIAGNQVGDIPKNLKIGGSLYIERTPLAKKYNARKIRQMIEDKGGYVENISNILETN